MSIDRGGVLTGRPMEHYVRRHIRRLIPRIRVDGLFRPSTQGDRVGDANLVDSDPAPTAVEGINDFDAHLLAGIRGQIDGVLPQGSMAVRENTGQ